MTRTASADRGWPRVAVIGSGYWGKNLVRNFHELGALAGFGVARRALGTADRRFVIGRALEDDGKAPGRRAPVARRPIDIGRTKISCGKRCWPTRTCL